MSPPLPLHPPANTYAAGAVKRFVENLLPEGRALDITATTCRVSKSNIFALINAFRFWRPDEVPPSIVATSPREVTRDELNLRLNERDSIPLAVWTGRSARPLRASRTN